MWFVTSQKHGASALGLKRVLNLGSYQTAWTWLHKMRRAMILPGRERLAGAVEVDETLIGGPEEDVHGRETYDKAIVVIAAERRGRAIGRIRLRQLGYTGLESLGYQHEVKNIKRSGEPAHKLLPRVHRVASLLKRWLLGTLEGGVQAHPLDYYLDEFTFRFNRRSSRSRGLLFLPLDATSGLGTSALLPKTRRGNRWYRPQDVEGTCAKWIATFQEVDKPWDSSMASLLRRLALCAPF